MATVSAFLKLVNYGNEVTRLTHGLCERPLSMMIWRSSQKIERASCHCHQKGSSSLPTVTRLGFALMTMIWESPCWPGGRHRSGTPPQKCILLSTTFINNNRVVLKSFGIARRGRCEAGIWSSLWSRFTCANRVEGKRGRGEGV